MIWALGIAAVFAAGAVQGCTGFGSALVAAPVLMLMLPPSAVVPVMVMLSTPISVFVALHARRGIRVNLALPMAVGGVLGIPLGVEILRVADALVMKAATGLFVALFASALLAGWRHPVRHTAARLAPVGLASGLLGASTSMGGPPVILFLASQNTPKDEFRANIALHFLVLNAAAIAVFYLRGMFTLNVMQFGGVLLIPLLTGTGFGIWSADRVPEKAFSTLAMAGVLLMGLVLAATSCWGLIHR